MKMEEMIGIKDYVDEKIPRKESIQMESKRFFATSISPNFMM